MAWRFALMIDPAAAGDDRADYDDTFTEVDPAAPALTAVLAAVRGGTRLGVGKTCRIRLERERGVDLRDLGLRARPPLRALV